MSDTIFMGRTISGAFKSVLIYAAIAFCLSLGDACFTLKKADWDSWWFVQKWGWVLLHVGAVLTTIKASVSSSTRKQAE